MSYTIIKPQLYSSLEPIPDASGQFLISDASLNPVWRNYPTNILLDNNTYSGANKQIVFSNTSTTDGHNMEMVIQSNKRSILRLNADTDNSGETVADSPLIVLSQDGGLNLLEVGLNSDNQSVINATNNFNNTMFLSNGGTPTMILTGTTIALQRTAFITEGSAAAPGLRFILWHSTGLCAPAENTLGLVGGGVVALQCDNLGTRMNRQLNMNGNRLIYAGGHSGTLTLSAGTGSVSNASVTVANSHIICSRIGYAVGTTALGYIQGSCSTNGTITFFSLRSNMAVETGDNSVISYVVCYNA